MARITVGMPVYNAETHIAEAIDSILHQSFGDLVLLISDNASTDDTEAICKRYTNLDNRIKYVRQPHNLGATENYNYVCRTSSSEFFKWHASNDYCTDETIEKCINVLDERPDIVLCYPLTRLFQQSREDATDFDDGMLLDDSSPINRFFHVIDNMTLNNVMNGVIRTSAIQKTRLIREFFHGDRNMLTELALMGKIIQTEGCIFYRRMDAESATHLKSDSDVLAHFDPRWKRPLSFTYWRIFYAYLSSLMRSKIGWMPIATALPILCRRVWWNKSRLWSDITTAIRFAVSDFRSAFSSGSKK